MSLNAYYKEYEESINDTVKYWEKQGKQLLKWDKDFTEVFKQTGSKCEWYRDGKVNACYNCIDRHIDDLSELKGSSCFEEEENRSFTENNVGTEYSTDIQLNDLPSTNSPHSKDIKSKNITSNDKIAIIYTDNDNNITKFTYKQCLKQICKISQILINQNLKKGDCVSIYMSMCPEAVFSVLACARLGIIHNVIFGGFSVDSILMRLRDSKTKFVITCDSVKRGKSFINFMSNVEQVLEIYPVNVLIFDDKKKSLESGYERVVCDGNKYVEGCDEGKNADCANAFNRSSSTTTPKKAPEPSKPISNTFTTKPSTNATEPSIKSKPSTYNKIYWSQSNIPYKYIKPVPVEAEHPLFYLYTSGSTGKPKGMIHTTAGYLVYASLTTRKCFDIQKNDIFACTADIGWITGHTYSIYGPLLNGITTVIFGGTPVYPDYYRLHSLVQDLRITQLYTAPTVVRTLRKYFSTVEFNRSFDLLSLRLLGSVGEPINKEAYKWFTEAFNNLHVVDTYWQTETGGIMIAPMPNTVIGQPECASLPMFGIEPAVIRSGENLTSGENSFGNIRKLDNTMNINKNYSTNSSYDTLSSNCTNDDNVNIVYDKINNEFNIKLNTGTDNSERIEYDAESRLGISNSTNDTNKLEEAQEYELGHIVIKKPWPGMARGVLNDKKRYKSYFNKSGYYITGDEGYKDKNNLFWIRGRADDVINVSGHRLSTAEIESAACTDPNVSEAAVVPIEDEITGQALCVFVVPKRDSSICVGGSAVDVNEGSKVCLEEESKISLKETSTFVNEESTLNVNKGTVIDTRQEFSTNVKEFSSGKNKLHNDLETKTNAIEENNKKLSTEEIAKSVKLTLRNKIGKLVTPKNVFVVEGLPKTATGKIMRRVLRDVLSGKVPDDMSTCINVEVLKGMNYSNKVE